MMRAHAALLLRLILLATTGASFVAAQISESHSVLQARDFIETPSLVAHARQTVLLDNQPNPLERPVIRYELDEGPHNFCLRAPPADITGMVLKDMFGNEIFQIPAYERCATLQLRGGIYELRFLPSDKQTFDSNLGARVEVDLPSPPLTDSKGDPIGGYWAIQPDPAADPQHRLGRLWATPPFKDLFHDPYLYAPVIADYNSRAIDDFSLFRLSGNSYLSAIPAVPTPGKQTIWTLGDAGTAGQAGLFILNDATGCAYVDCDILYYGTFKFTDLGNQKFQFGSANRPYGLVKTPYSNSQLSFTFDPKGLPFTVFSLLFRFFPAGSQVGTLRPGEAALFQSCGYAGKAAVFAPGISDLTALNSSAITIDNSAKSIRLGNNTAILWHTPTSQLTAITASTACLPAGSAAPAGKDFEVLPLATLLSDPSEAAALDKKCIGCNLTGAHLTTVNLSGWNLSGANFSAAALTDVKLDKATLDGAVFAGAKLSCVDFSGADQAHPADLSSVDFSAVQWPQNDECKSNFKYTLLSIAKLPPSSWKYLDLSGATFVDAKGHQLSNEAHPLDLSGVPLIGVSLQGAILDYATGLNGANLTQAVLSGASLRHVNLSNARLYGAQLNNANLDGANLSGAHLIKPSTNGGAANLQGAFLRNVNLSQGKIQGADFTNASFYSSAAVGTGLCTPDGNGFTHGCATASHATMDLTKFNAAYLFGVDFTGATAQGVNFGNSFLAGSNFAGAILSADTSGSDTGFTGAFLQGANLSGVILQNGLSLQNAFVDFSPEGNTISLILSGEHTTFAGYWNTPGQSVCAAMAYNNPTGTPQTDGNVTCPDGFRYPNGCGPPSPDGSNPGWKSAVDITGVASYATNATYTAASPHPICQSDPKWIPFKLSRHKSEGGER